MRMSFYEEYRRKLYLWIGNVSHTDSLSRCPNCGTSVSRQKVDKDPKDEIYIAKRNSGGRGIEIGNKVSFAEDRELYHRLRKKIDKILKAGMEEYLQRRCFCDVCCPESNGLDVTFEEMVEPY